LAVKAAPKRGTAEPAAEGAGADIRPKGRVNGGASQVAQQATVRQEGGAQRPNGREIHLLAYGIGSRTLRFLAKRRRRSTTTFRERALRRLFSTGRKNAYFFKTDNGSHAGYVFMSLIGLHPEYFPRPLGYRPPVRLSHRCRG